MSIDAFAVPVQLVRPSENHESIHICEEGIQALASIKNPVQVISVIGTQRTGKSTILNLLHSRRTNGFGLGHYMDAQTQGLWIWLRQHPRNADLTVVLMDTEGLDTPHVAQHYNWTLSALALLVSNYVIYQSKGAIESSAVDRLGAMLTLAQHLRGKTEAGTTDPPIFNWLIRDHQLHLKTSPKEEMESKLDERSRSLLERCFERNDCFLLPRPVDRDDLLCNVDTLQFAELTPQFREEYAIIERQIFAEVSSPRRLGGSVVTGEMVANLISKYTSIISQSNGIIKSLQQLPTQRQLIINMMGDRAVQSGLNAYIDTMATLRSQLPQPLRSILNQHRLAVAAANTAFDESAGMYREDSEEFRLIMTSKITETELSLTCHHDRRGVDASPLLAENRVIISGILASIWQENVELRYQKAKHEFERHYEQEISQKLNENSIASIPDFDHLVELKVKMPLLTLVNVLGEEVYRVLHEREQQISKDRCQLAHKLYNSHNEECKHQLSMAIEEMKREYVSSLETHKTYSQQLEHRIDELEQHLASLKNALNTTNTKTDAVEKKISCIVDETLHGIKEKGDTLATALDRHQITSQETYNEIHRKLETLQTQVHSGEKQLEATACEIKDDLKQIEHWQNKQEKDAATQIDLFKEEAKYRKQVFDSLRSDLTEAIMATHAKAEEAIRLAQKSTDTTVTSEQIKDSEQRVQQKIAETEDNISSRCREMFGLLERKFQNMMHQRLSVAEESSQKQQQQSVSHVSQMLDGIQEQQSFALSSLKSATDQAIEKLSMQQRVVYLRLSALSGYESPPLDQLSEATASSLPQGVSIRAVKDQIREVSSSVNETKDSIQAFWQIISDFATKAAMMEEFIVMNGAKPQTQQKK